MRNKYFFYIDTLFAPLDKKTETLYVSIRIQAVHLRKEKEETI